MKTVFLNVFDMSVTASFVILAILLIRLLLRKAPRKYSYALWGAAAFRLSCPFSFEAAFSLFNLSFSLSKTVGVSIREVPGHSSAETLLPKISVPAVQMPVSEAETVIVPAPAEVTADPMQTLVQIASILWLIGMAALLGYAVFSWIRLKRQLWNAVRLEDNVWQSETVRSPFIFGLFRPRIYIPYGMDETVREYVLAHERYHLKRLDHIVKPLAFLLLSVHWFNPLVWLAFWLMGRDMEMSCDEKVLGSRENIRKAYSTTLLSFAAGRPFPLPSPLAFGETAVKSRIKNVLNWKKPTLWITIAAAVIAIIVIAVCIADPASTISGMESVNYNDKAVSEEAGMELVQMVNSSGKTIHAKNYARSADDDSIVTIRCEDGSFYELHYWYYSGFSFNPLHPGEDDYCSILTRYDASGKAKRAWKMAYDFDEHFESWLEANLGYTAPPFGQNYRLAAYAYENPGYPGYKLSDLPEYAVTAEGDLLEKPAGSTEWITLGRMESFELTKDNFDRYAGEDGWSTLLTSAAKLRRNNAEAWQLLTDKELYYLLRQKDGDLYLAIGWYDASEADDHYSDDSTIRWICSLTEEDDVAFENIEGSYVSWQCLYMSPLNSFAGIGGDSGCRYLITADAFTIQDRNGGKQVFKTDWNWQDFSYSDEEWTELTAPFGGPDLSARSQKLQLSLSSRYDLLWMDGELWLVQFGSHPNETAYIWSIYSLIPESAMGFAEWEFHPAVSSVYPAFPFTFDMDYDEITVFCSEGNLIDYDAVGNKAITDTFLTFPAGNRVYWCPMDDDGVSTGAELSFTMQRGDTTVAAGTVYITGSGNLYTARLVGTGLVMTQSEEYGAVISLMEESYQQRTVWPADSPGGGVSYPAGEISWKENYAGIRLTLPEGWTGEVIGANEDLNCYAGISFRPANEELHFDLMFHADTAAICGTGVTFTEMELKNGIEAVLATENFSNEIWIKIFFADQPGSYTLETSVPKKQWEQYRETVLDILGTAVFGEGMLRESEAVSIAEEYCTIDADRTRAGFDFETGQWTVRFTGGSHEQMIYVEPDGSVDTVMSGTMRNE